MLASTTEMWAPAESDGPTLQAKPGACRTCLDCHTLLLLVLLQAAAVAALRARCNVSAGRQLRTGVGRSIGAVDSTIRVDVAPAIRERAGCQRSNREGAQVAALPFGPTRRRQQHQQCHG